MLEMLDRLDLRMQLLCDLSTILMKYNVKWDDKQAITDIIWKMADSKIADQLEDLQSTINIKLGIFGKDSE